MQQTLAQNDYVRIDLVAYGDDLRAAERSLREVINAEDDRFSPDIGGAGELATDNGIINRLLEQLPQALDERQDALEERLATLRQQFVDACHGRGNIRRSFQQLPETGVREKP